MQLLAGSTNDVGLMPRVLAHYQNVAPLMEASFAGAPIVYKNYPAGTENPGVFHVMEAKLDVKKLLWLIHAKHAIEFFTWAPLPSDDYRLRFGRIQIEAPYGVEFSRVKRAAISLREILRNEWKLQSIPQVDGRGGIVLWLPFADAPHAAGLRAWLHSVANQAAMQFPDQITTESNTHDDDRAYVHVGTNAAGQYSAMPYSLYAHGVAVCAPISWSELDDLPHAGYFTAETFAERLRRYGDIFAKDVSKIGKQLSPWAGGASPAQPPAPRNGVITAAVDVLGDGRPRTAHEILSAAIARQLMPPSTRNKFVWSALVEYIARQRGHGRKPPIIQDVQRRFRINELPDDWPDLMPHPTPHADVAVHALCDRLEETSTGKDAGAFEASVCDAFARLGFLTRRLSESGAADGVGDAILGIDGYRVAIECSTAKDVVNNLAPGEVARFRETHGADYSVMVGPQFPEEIEFLQELQANNVTALSVPELQTLLHINANPLEVKGVLASESASDVIADLLWERSHGPIKRVATIAHIIAREGWKIQRTAAEMGGRDEAPQLTANGAKLLVDVVLRAAGTTQSCTYDEVREAFEWLASPSVGLAKFEPEQDSLVILRPPAG